MKRLLPLLVLLLPLASGCKESGWTFLKRAGGETTAETAPVQPAPAQPTPEQPKPAPEVQDTRDIIFVLGIDGID